MGVTLHYNRKGLAAFNASPVVSRSCQVGDEQADSWVPVHCEAEPKSLAPQAADCYESEVSEQLVAELNSATRANYMQS